MRPHESYWANRAEELLWDKKWHHVLEGTVPHTTWFSDGTLNVSANCLDRHVASGKGQKIAIYWEGEDGEERTFTYQDLLREVNRCASALQASGVQKGDRVTIYMGLQPEAVIAMLACARIGAIHCVVFGGFGYESLAKRMADSGSKIVFTSDVALRKGKKIYLKQNVDLALRTCPQVTRVIVSQRNKTSIEAPLIEERDILWSQWMQTADTEVEPVSMNAEDTLFILHTSGTTGKPKGIVHSTAGYLLGASTSFKDVFQPQENDIYWCTADIGWITGHSYVVYGPLANGASVVMYEGALDCPDYHRTWDICEKYGVTIFYTAPTAIRTFMRWGDSYPQARNLTALRLLGSVGEPLNPEAWEWYRAIIGKNTCPIMDTWWQTETGMIMIAPLQSQDQKPGSAGQPLPGIAATVVDEAGQEVLAETDGYLVVTEPWPSMLRGIWQDEERYLQTYWSRFPGMYFTKDRCRRDSDGCYRLLGRVDDVMIVSGHNLSTAEIEAALTTHPDIVEAAVTGTQDSVSGQSVTAFVVQNKTSMRDPAVVRDELKTLVAKTIGSIAKPKKILLVQDLPKTRSGKIMRRLLQSITEHQPLGDISTIANPESLSEITELWEQDSLT